MQSLNEMPEPTPDELRQIESEMAELDAELAAALDAKRSRIPSKAKTRERPTFGIQRLDTLYKDPANWEPWSNVTLVYRKPGRLDRLDSAFDLVTGPVDTILGFFVCYKHREVKGARKLVRSAADPLLGTEFEYVSDPWYLDWAPARHHSAESTELHFPVALRIILDDGLRSEGEHVLHIGATRGVGIRRAVLDTAVRLSHDKTILYLPAGLDLLDGLAMECKVKLKEAFDANASSS
jgi:hypothetical protein